MAKVRSGTSKVKPRPALTPEARENQLIAEAMDLAEEQILAGTASSQVISHFLKLGSTKAQIELEKLRSENELLRAKKEALDSTRHIEELYTEAMSAMKNYGVDSANGGSGDA